MSDDEVTQKDSPFARMIEGMLAGQLAGFEERLIDRLGRLIELSEVRIALAVEKRLERRLRASQTASDRRLNECERRIANLEELVFSRTGLSPSSDTMPVVRDTIPAPEEP